MKVCLAGQGAFGVKHLEAMAKIPGIEVISLVGSTKEAAARRRANSAIFLIGPANLPRAWSSPDWKPSS